MTRQDAIKILNKYDLNFCDIDGNPIPPQDLVEAFDMAIKALEQEPCEDCISRERLRESLKKELVIVNNNEMYWQGWHDCTVAVETRITDAPSVAPKRGKWIDDDNYLSYANCSECGYQMDMHEERGYHNFCPNCGARMESDEQ